MYIHYIHIIYLISNGSSIHWSVSNDSFFGCEWIVICFTVFQIDLGCRLCVNCQFIEFVLSARKRKQWESVKMRNAIHFQWCAIFYKYKIGLTETEQKHYSLFICRKLFRMYFFLLGCVTSYMHLRTYNKMVTLWFNDDEFDSNSAYIRRHHCHNCDGTDCDAMWIENACIHRHIASSAILSVHFIANSIKI